jgi:hypothetical protein
MIYQAGYITVNNSSTQAEGFGTYWLTYCHASDELVIDGVTYLIASIQDNHLLTLSTAYAGTSIERGGYLINAFDVVETLDDYKAATKIEVNKLAENKILKVLPGYKQNNLQAIASKIPESRWATDPTWLIINLAWDFIANVVNASNTANTAVLAATDKAAIITIVDSYVTTLSGIVLAPTTL